VNDLQLLLAVDGDVNKFSDDGRSPIYFASAIRLQRLRPINNATTRPSQLAPKENWKLYFGALRDYKINISITG
jgi:hypothetical protein